MQNLPIGIQSFEKLRRENYLYVDKTEVIHRLITSGQVFFLSRPRRFGKSLLVSTMEAIFKGQKELFDGLYIQDKIDWTQLKHPVIRIDFGGVNNNTPENLQQDIEDVLSQIAQQQGISLERKGAGSFTELIEKLHQVTGYQVVVLIDEYDKAIIDNITSSEIMEGNKKVLHDFYQVLKAADEHLRFVFLTGVTKFAGLSIFSGLNNLNDITLVDKYATICGYTQQELENSFGEYMDTIAQHLSMRNKEILDGIRIWYDGYSWDGKTAIYNPFSTLLLFENEEFSNYWFRTGTPTFLIEFLMLRDQLKPVLEPVILGAGSFDSFDPQGINEIPLLFQTGYLTIKHKEYFEGQPQYTIEMPNREVRESLLQHLLSAYSHYPLGQSLLIQDMKKQLIAQDASGLEKNLREMLAYIPYQLHIGKEAYYHSLLLLWLRLLGFDVSGEVNTNKGRIDAVLQLPEHTIIAEVKYQVKKEKISSLLDKAMKQIREMDYAERHVETGHAPSLLAIAFAGKEIGCRMEAF
jgi:hypothetical protein